MAINTIDLAEKFGSFDDQWSPKIAGELNGQYLKLAKLEGEFMWHRHADEDELFLVVHGTLTIKLRDQELTLREGEVAIIPRGVEHLPVAPEEVWVVLLEPKTTRNTGEVVNGRTISEETWI